METLNVVNEQSVLKLKRSSAHLESFDYLSKRIKLTLSLDYNSSYSLAVHEQETIMENPNEDSQDRTWGLIGSEKIGTRDFLSGLEPALKLENMKQDSSNLLMNVMGYVGEKAWRDPHPGDKFEIIIKGRDPA